jgi:hypothetical protein
MREQGALMKIGWYQFGGVWWKMISPNKALYHCRSYQEDRG